MATESHANNGLWMDRLLQNWWQSRRVMLHHAGRRRVFSGGGGIRTHGTLTSTPVFKTGALNRSATPPSRGNAWRSLDSTRKRARHAPLAFNEERSFRRRNGIGGSSL